MVYTMKKYVAFMLTFLASHISTAEWATHEFDVMGTRASVELWADKDMQASKLFAAVENEMRRIERVMSPYIETSELSAINRLDKNEILNISSEMYTVINKALYFSDITHGAFDISFASVGFLYDYRQRRQPDELTRLQSLAAVDYKSILLAKPYIEEDLAGQYTIQFLREGMKIDLGGIAKGYAVDQSIAILKEQGVLSALVSAGGDTRILGDRGKANASAETLPWIVGIKHPRDKTQQAMRLPLSDTAISTSGDYERFFIENGERIHHIIHPATGKSSSGIVSATVIGPESISCDALSTSIFVLGVEKGLKLIDEIIDYDAIIIDTDGKVHYSSGLTAQ